MAEEIPKQTTQEQETTAPTGKNKKDIGKSLRMKFFSINLFSLSFMSNGLN